MDILVTLLVGLIIGLIASAISHTRKGGIVVDIIVGLLGSFFARAIFGQFFLAANAAGTFSVAGIFWGALGAIVLLAIVRLFTREF